MMIEDEELRSLYQTTCQGRMQVLEAGLLHAQPMPAVAQLEVLRREAHSLKGDSRVMGLEDIGTLAHHLELAMKALQQQSIEWRSPLTDRLRQTFDAIAKLIESATTGADAEVDVLQVGEDLQSAMTVTTLTLPVAGLSTHWIADADVRSLYAITSDRRLQSLRQALQQLSQASSAQFSAAQASAILATFRDEAQGLKGDSQEVGQGAVAAIAQQFEVISNRFMSSFGLAAGGPIAILQTVLWQGIQLIEQLRSVAVNKSDLNPPTSEDLVQFFTQLDSQVELAFKSGEVGETSFSGTDLIEDRELRDIYKETSEGRLQRLEAGLLQLVEVPDDQAVLHAVIQEVHGLKGDAHSTGIMPVALLSASIETVLEKIQQREIVLTPELTQSFRDCLMAMGAMVQTATVGTVSGVNIAQLTQNLSLIADQVGSSDALLPDALLPEENLLESIPVALGKISADVYIDDSDGNRADQEPLENNDFDSVSIAVSTIEDEELRAVYRTVSTERLQRLESGLEQLASRPLHADTISELLRETHSLKGDARSVELGSVASLAHAIESLLVGLQKQALSPNESTSGESTSGEATLGEATSGEATLGADVLRIEVADVLYQALDAVKQLIDEAITGLPIAMVNTEQLLQQMQATTLLMSATTQPLPVADEIQPPSDPLVRPDLAAREDQAVLIPETRPVSASAIEDDELREVYRVASAERLQKLELGLVALEREPRNADTLAELLRESHSLKGDARSVGLDHVGSLAHGLESILVGIQATTVSLSGDVSDLLYEGLDAIAQRIEEAISGLPFAGKVESTEQLLVRLRNAAPALVDSFVQADFSDVFLTPDQVPIRFASSDTRSATRDPSTADTIRVKIRDLDTLAGQAEQLTLTRIQTAQTTVKMAKLLSLWEQWRTYRNTHPVAPDGILEDSPNPYEGPLDNLMSQLRIATQENSFRLDLLSQDLVQQVQMLRLLPIDSVLRVFPRVVRDLARQQAKSVELITEGGETTADKRILEEIQDSLMHLVRNALDHGIETPEEREAAGKSPTAKLWIRSYQSPNSIVIEVADDGRGLDLAKIKQTAVRRKLYGADELSGFSADQIQDLIFVPGFSTRSFTTEISGRGVGLDVVRNQIERLKGNIQLDSTPGKGCTFRLQISTQLATANVVFIQVRGIIHALPIEFLQTTMRISRDEIVTVEGKDSIQWNERTLPITDLFDVLELGNSPAYQPPTEPVPDSQKACLLLKVGDEMGAFLVDRLLDTQEVIFKPQSALLKRVRNVTGSTILGNGEICTILNPSDLIKSIQRKNEVVAFAQPLAAQPRKFLILLVEDSPPVRIQEKRLFENAGYDVVTAENGLEGYNLLRAGDFDAVVSDIEMPELDGLSLVSKIREHSEYDELPIVLVTTLSSGEDRRKGADAGANAYIVKGKFNQEVLLETLHRLI